MTINEKPHSMDGEIGPIAGETIKDPARWPGYLLIAVGVAALALGLTGLATGRVAAGVGGIAVFVIACLLGVAWQYVEHRRIQRQASTGTPERPEDTAAL